MQADVHGDFDAVTRRMIGKDEPVKLCAAPARLAREWAGRVHDVVVLDDGVVVYEGARFASLSAVTQVFNTTAAWGD